jgi:murein DD-endopeptidase MepM/ murein hydrolase activator NlpD
LLNASVGVQRVIGRLRRPESQEPNRAITLQHRSRIAARHVRRSVDSATSSARFLPRGAHRRRTITLPSLPTLAVLGRMGHERTVAVAVAGIVLGASVLSIAPGGAPSGDTGGPTGDGSAPRLAVGGTIDDDSPVGYVETAYLDEFTDPTDTEALAPAANVRPSMRPASDQGDATGVPGTEAVGDIEPAAVEGPFLADGTLLKPVAVDTSVQDGRDLVRTYKVKAGDTLVEIARDHGVSMMTLWWANKLENKDDLHRGQVLKIPPVTGLVVKVKAGDTLAALAKEHKVTEAKILETNEIEDPNLVVGQVLILPGAKGDPIPTPKPTKKATTSRGSSGGGSSGGSSRPPKTYSGGNFAWPAPGGRISQYYHYGHYGLDIDGSSGDRIVAAASGTVTFAGWKSNGGGYQVWIAHGSGLYTTYNHMSSVSVGRGQHVSKGQRVGRMGATGFATGSHLHFEVWKGPIWSGGRRVNPLAYL